ncbi:Ig-like domain-containing protein [Cytobacillus oceanisediminis]|uniref:Ig-like domain-containing protein n=1 Tax=Cytobacillus oceanisediminis TaxID=665099 RepID=UPI0023DA7AAB|nr:Ig-like domain-containing protein [Cytobacillus oceanisediminis]MDF2037682.1 Ig-like domain-containing protein [Cytobacillus oceanisediminis]
MKKLLSIILVLQLLLVPAAASAQGEDEKSKQAGETISADFSVDSKPRLSLEGEANYQDPSNYPLKNNGELIDVLIDSYGVNHSTYFNNLATSPDNSEYMELSLLYSSNQSSPKDGLLTIEFYKEANNSLSYVGGSDFPVAWFTEATLSVDLQKSYFADQRYIYIRIGTSQSSSDTYYSDVTLFKVENPFASVNPSLPPNQYAVISNESVDAETAQSSGTFDVKDMKYTKDMSLKPSAYKVDYDKPFDSSSNKGKLLEKNTKSINSSYSVGDYKYFWVSNLTTNANEQINARLAYSGTKANIWVHNNEITDSDAEKLGIEFDSKIHSSVTNHFGTESDVNNDGKINILTYDIQDGFSGSGGYVAGYFWAGDLFDVTGSNKSEIFYIDTYPAMGMGSVKDVASSYETLAHEFQHMVNFNRNSLIEGGSTMDTWLNESLSMAAEQIYTGQGLEDRVNYYNVSTAIQNGHSLLYWDRSGDTLSNYSLSYLFGQYLKIQTGQGDQIFKEILQDPSNDYKAIENAAKKYIDPNMTFGKLMTNFRIALLLKERNGLHGFKGDPFFDSINEKIFSGNTVNLRGGGSVVTAFNSEEGFEEPAEKGADITYTILDMNSGETDITPPVSPVLNKVGDSDSAITGTAEANATVYAIVGGSEIGRNTANQAGGFQLSISPQKAGTRIEVYAMDPSGNVSEPAIVTVEDVTAPGTPQVNNVTDQDSSVTGTAEQNSEITVTAGTESWSGNVNTEGQFSVAIPKQKAGTLIGVTAKDAAGNVSEAAATTVVDKTPPAAPMVNKVTDQSMAVTGSAEKDSEVTVKIGTGSWKGTAGSEGNFSVSIPKQTAGTQIEVTAKDAAGNVSQAAKVTVVDGDIPAAPIVRKVTDQSTAVTGNAEVDSEINVKIGTASWKGITDAEGIFSVAIPKQKVGTIIEVTATDREGNVSPSAKVTVVDGTPPAAPTVNKVNDQAAAVTGSAEKGSEVTVKIGTDSWKGTANTEGQFSITIPKQKAGTIIEVTAKDAAGNVSAATKVTVVDEIAPAAPTVNKVTDQSTTITGSAEKGSEVTVKTEMDSWKGTANEEGQFSVTIQKQKAGTVIEVTAKDEAGNVSTATKVTVVDEAAPTAPTVNKVTDQATAVTGSAEKGAEVTVKIGIASWKGKANAEGQFSIEIPKQKAGTVIEVTAKDEAGNVSAATKVTVLDETAPAAPTVNKVTDQSTAVTGSAERGAEVTVKIGTSSWKGMADTEGKFSITIPKQKTGTVIEVTAKDAAANTSSAVKVTVVDGTPPAAPVVNTVSDRNLKIFGTAEPGSTISVRIGNSEIGKGVTGENGFFAVEIPAHPTAGTELVIIAFDAAGNASNSTRVKVIKGNTQLSKLVGKTRYTTAIEISKKGWSASDTVFLVNGWAIADGLTATPLASAKNAPILLAATNSLPEETIAEIKRLKAKNIVLIGGSGVISDEVKNSLISQGYSVSRIGGKTRYETSVKIAQELDKLVDVHTVYMAYGHGEPDALSIAAQSGQTKQPIILTEKKAVPANTYQWLKGEGLQTSYFIGGKGVISPAIITEMDSITTKSVVNNRLSGVNRQETNAKVIQTFYKQEEMPTIMVAHASTPKLVDALAAGPLAAKYNVPVLLVSSKLDPLQVNVIKGKHANDVHQIGGGIGEPVLKQVVDLMN